MPPVRQNINLNTIIGAMTILGMLITGVFFIAPLRTLPGDVDSVKRTQIIQTEALKTLADLARESKDLRRDFDKHSATSEAKDAEQDRRLDRISQQLDRIPVR
jgi:hypothetical protein